MLFLNSRCKSKSGNGGGGGPAADYSFTSTKVMSPNSAFYSPAGTFSVTTAFTASVWFKINNALNASNILMSHWDQSSPGGKWRALMNATGNIQVIGYDGSSVAQKDYVTTAAFDDDGWHHLAVTWGSSALKVFIDGAELTGGALTKTTDNALTLNTGSYRVGVGGLPNGALTQEGFESGFIDDFSYFSVDVGASGVTSLYNGGKPGNLISHSDFANCELWYLLGDDVSDTTTTVQDQIGVNHLTGYNTPNLAFNSYAPSITPGYSHMSANIPTAATGWRVPYAATFNYSTAMSGALWVKHAGVSAISSVFSQYNQSGNVGKWLMQMQATGELQVVLTDTGGSIIKVYRTTATHDDNTWYHFAFTYSTTNGLKVYVDGTELTGGAINKITDGANNSLNAVSNDVVIGGRWSSPTSITQGFNGGRIDEPSLFSVELSSAEVSELYNSGAPFDLSTHSQSGNLDWWARVGESPLDSSNLLDDQVSTNDAVNAGTPVFIKDAP